MASNKLYRTNEDIRYVLSRLIPQVKDPRVNQGGMISITGVDTTGDLRYCKVYLSVLGTIDEKEFKKGMKSASPWLRHELGSSLNLRYTPELIFELDHSIEHGAYINSIIDAPGFLGNTADEPENTAEEPEDCPEENRPEA